MTAVSQAIHLNREGVELLEMGSSTRAMACFQRALALMKAGIVDFDDAPMDASEEVIVNLKPSSSCIAKLQTGCNYVFNRALMVVEDKHVLDNEKVLLINCAIILFNFALSCHQDGEYGNVKSLRKASQLYNMTLQVLIDADMQDNDPSCAVIALLALNNRAQIHYDMMDYQESRICVIEMSSIMTSIQHQLDRCGALSDVDIEGLLLNMMLLEPPTAAQAA